jgi:hypothetical protein
MDYSQTPTYSLAQQRARAAFSMGFDNQAAGNNADAWGLLLHTYSDLRRLSGDLPILNRADAPSNSMNISFITQSLAEAQAWGWHEFTNGALHLLENRPGRSLVHFKRAWRIWRPWSLHASRVEEKQEATYERLRASLWLGEAWSRLISEHATHVASAIMNAALKEIERNGLYNLLQETIHQQHLLPLAPSGTSAHQSSQPFIYLVCIQKGFPLPSGDESTMINKNVQ